MFLGSLEFEVRHGLNAIDLCGGGLEGKPFRSCIIDLQAGSHGSCCCCCCCCCCKRGLRRTNISPIWERVLTRLHLLVGEAPHPYKSISAAAPACLQKDPGLRTRLHRRGVWRSCVAHEVACLLSSASRLRSYLLGRWIGSLDSIRQVRGDFSPSCPRCEAVGLEARPPSPDKRRGCLSQALRTPAVMQFSVRKSGFLHALRRITLINSSYRWYIIAIVIPTQVELGRSYRLVESYIAQFERCESQHKMRQSWNRTLKIIDDGAKGGYGVLAAVA